MPRCHLSTRATKQALLLESIGRVRDVVIWPVAGAEPPPALYSSDRLGARISRDRVARKWMSSRGAQVAPTFQVVT